MDNSPVNEAEEFVLEVCRRSFLSLWCYNNPRGKDNKELCDILVVCDPHVVVVSVKEIQLNPSNSQAHQERWTRKAVDASVNQIYGAERWLAGASHVIRSDGLRGLELPPLDRRKVHRIAVAFGSRGEVGIRSGNFGKGYAHVMTEDSFHVILNELDTVTDMVEYLHAKEEFGAKCSTIMEGTERDLLGLYLLHERRFPDQPDLMILMDDIWDGLCNRPEYANRKAADKESYTWDRLIECLSDPNAKHVDGPITDLTMSEVALRIMARENRLARRLLGRSTSDFLEQAKANLLRSRIMSSNISNVVYVVVYFKDIDDAKYRIAELGRRCLVARYKLGKGNDVIGIGIGQFESGIGSTSDLIYLDARGWSVEDDEHVRQMQADLGYFANARMQHSSEDEYPNAP